MFTIVRAIGGALAKHSPTREGNWVQILDNGSYTHGDFVDCPDQVIKFMRDTH